MREPFVQELIEALREHGFSEVEGDASTPDILLKRQTLNMNRAVLVHFMQSMPPDFPQYIRDLRRRIAFRVHFVPFFWGLGIQLVIIAPGSAQSPINPTDFVAQVDNFWAIIQSFFLVDPANGTYASARTWGQVISGKYQDAIAEVLSRHFTTPLSFLREKRERL